MHGANALHDQEGERALAGIGHQVRPARRRREGLSRLQADLLLGVLQEQPHLAFQHVERVADIGMEVPGHGLGRRELQLADPEARAFCVTRPTLDFIQVASIRHRL